MTNQPPLNPDALSRASDTISDRYDGNGYEGTADEIAEDAIRAYLAAAQPEVLANSKPNQNLEFAQPEVNTTERIWRDSAEGLDENAREIAQQSSRQMLVSDGFKTMARHLVTTYELHRQTGTRAAPPVAPPGADEIMKNSSVREAHTIETRQNTFTRGEWLHCTCGWTSAKVLAEGMDWKTEKQRHIMDSLTEE